MNETRKQRRRPGRPAVLSADRILDAALAILDETGSLNMTDLGTRLGVDPSAPYRYFRGRSELMSAVADRFTAPLREPAPTTGSWRGDFEALVRRFSDLYRSRPAIAVAIVTEAEISGPILGVLAEGVDMLRMSGASERDVFVAMHAIEVAIVGSITYDTVGAPDDDDVRRRYHRSIGRVDVDALFPTKEDLAAESFEAMWLLVGSALDWLESRRDDR